MFQGEAYSFSLKTVFTFSFGIPLQLSSSLKTSSLRPFLWDKMAKLELCEMACGNSSRQIASAVHGAPCPPPGKCEMRALSPVFLALSLKIE